MKRAALILLLLQEACFPTLIVSPFRPMILPIMALGHSRLTTERLLPC